MTLQKTAEAATFAWDDLSERLERFIATWDTGGEPTLVEFLPPEPPTHRRMVLIELVKVDLEQRTQRGRKKKLETYTAEFPELLENGEPPCDLIYEEYHICRTAGADRSTRWSSAPCRRGGSGRTRFRPPLPRCSGSRTRLLPP